MFTPLINAQLNSSSPHNYSGIPNEPLGPAWQTYFQVTETLPNVTEPISRNFAGNIPVNRAGHPNNTLFFWAFEKQNGSLTSSVGENSDEPFLIWLNGGPGSSSLVGLMTENGPLLVTETYSLIQNNFSWHKLVDAIWVDQPVGAGYSTSDSTGYVADEDQVGEDFIGFLSNLVKVFPSLATRPMYLTGESYAGTFIPYITKAIFSTPEPPVNLRKIAIGDGTLGSLAVFEELPTLTVLETYPQIINYDPDVFNYFKDQEHLCGYDLNLTYPATAPMQTLQDPFNTVSTASAAVLSQQRKAYRQYFKSGFKALIANASIEGNVTVKRDRLLREAETRRSMAPIKRSPTRLGELRVLNGQFGCFLWSEMIQYAMASSFPWNIGEFDPYDIPDALSPEAPSDPGVFLNDERTRAALHAPVKDWEFVVNYPFGNSLAWESSKQPGKNEFGDPSVEPSAFLSELASNASARGVGIIFYSGNDDSLVAHRGTEVVIQNMTFGGIQGFTRKPSTPWYDDHGNFAGIVHQERNLTYVLFQSAGHFVPRSVPEAAFVFLREFVLGSNTTGSVVGSGVVGGEDAKLMEDVLPGSSVIFYGSGSTASSTAAPTATIAAWNSFIATATASSSATTTTTTSNAPNSTRRTAGLALPPFTLTILTIFFSCLIAPRI